MKRNIVLSLLAVLLIAVSCDPYEDYLLDEYKYTAVYFPTQRLPRTAVCGEGMEIWVGAYIGGVRENKEDRSIRFELDTSLISGTYDLLPEDYYTISSPDEIIIPEGKFQGFVEIKFDSLKFMNDPDCLSHNYALPFRIVDAPDVDSVLEGQSTVVIPIKYMNTFEGYYHQIGVVKQFTDLNGTDLVQAFPYGDDYDWTNSPKRLLTTLSGDEVMIDGIGYLKGGDKAYYMKLKIDYDNNSVQVDSIPGMLFQVEQDGDCTWDPTTRTFELKYKYEDNGMLHMVDETLVFRNRIRDGISEWQWPGFEGN